jgi:hypothetical protein
MIDNVTINGLRIVTEGKWLKTASVHDEVWTEGQVVTDPPNLIAKLKTRSTRADIFTFVQKIPDTQPRFPYFFEWDNVAAIPLSTFKDWWENHATQVTRKNVRRSAKRGIVVRRVALSDSLIQGITGIYNETPIRQGKKFPHYGKDFVRIKAEASTLTDRSEFIGAYFGEELVGFIKLVYMGPISSILHIVSKNAHYDKRPTNALITKAVELSLEHGAAYLVYGNYYYGNKTESPLTEFKRRNGFVKMDFPRYYVPLTRKGKLAIKLRLHKGALGLLPSSFISILWKIRSAFYQLRSSLRAHFRDSSPRPPEESGAEDT